MPELDTLHGLEFQINRATKQWQSRGQAFHSMGWFVLDIAAFASLQYVTLTLSGREKGPENRGRKGINICANKYATEC